MKSILNNKKLLLTNVWAARDNYSPAETITQNRHPVVSANVMAWKKRLKGEKIKTSSSNHPTKNFT